MSDLDLSKIEIEELLKINNQVLKQIALKAKLNLGDAASAHDSHSSNHSNHSRLADIQKQLDSIANELSKHQR